MTSVDELRLRYSRRRQVWWVSAYFVCSSVPIVALFSSGADRGAVFEVIRVAMLSLVAVVCGAGFVASVLRLVREPIALRIAADRVSVRSWTQRLVVRPVDELTSMRRDGFTLVVKTRTRRFVLTGLDADDMGLVASWCKRNDVDFSDDRAVIEPT